MKDTYVDIILPLSLEGIFTYSVPEHLKDEDLLFRRVLVEFGRRKQYTGIVLKTHSEKPNGFKTKEIIDLSGNEPVINNRQLTFWKWIWDYYMAAPGEVMRAGIPASLRIESETWFYASDTPENFESAQGEIIFKMIFHGGGMKASDLFIQLKRSKIPLARLNELIDIRAITAGEKLGKGFTAKKARYIRMAAQFQNETELDLLLEKLRRAPAQKETLIRFLNDSEFFSQRDIEIEWNEFLKLTGGSASLVNALIKKGVLTVEERTIARLEENQVSGIHLNKLNESQLKAFSEVQEQFLNRDTVLLEGVTSSGKTEVYLHLIDIYLKQGKQVLYLLPEIALTSQIIRRIRRAFGSLVGIFHSGFSDSERTEVYQELLKGEYSKLKVVLAVRSGIFLPFHDLGLIIVDEEHEQTYKQVDPSPRYHARDSVQVLAGIHHAKVILGTATPSVESMHNAKTGKYGYVQLLTRYGDVQLPEIRIADMRKAVKRKQMVSFFTPELYDDIREALDSKEQVILFQNRRGYAPYIQCQECGWVPNCTQCDVSMTYHRANHSLECHHCGQRAKVYSYCQKCGSSGLKSMGFGTERIEEEINIVFPGVRVARLDTDITRSKGRLSQTIETFEQRETDILIGTQIVTKGLDFEHVRVVGVLNADHLMTFPDFRANERSFQLLSQVSGRAGRRGKRGKVVIQSYMPDSFLLDCVVKNDFHSFYEQQIRERSEFRYPPLFRMVRVVMKNKNQEKLQTLSERTSELLNNEFPGKIMGPEPPLIARVSNWYIRNILVRLDRVKELPLYKCRIRDLVKESIQKYGDTTTSVYFDVDPY